MQNSLFKKKKKVVEVSIYRKLYRAVRENKLILYLLPWNDVQSLFVSLKPSAKAIH